MHSKRIQEKVKGDYDMIARDFSSTRRALWADFDLFQQELMIYVKEFKKNQAENASWNGEKRKLRILDLGCGNGRLLLGLKEWFEDDFDYIGVDQSSGLLDEARKKHPEQVFIESDFSEILKTGNSCIDEGGFDFIFSIAAFHHLGPKDQLNTLNDWSSLLKKDGLLVLTNWNLHQKRFWKLWLKHLWHHPYGFRGLLIPWKDQVQRYYYSFTKMRLKSLLEKAGFRLLIHDYVKKGEKSGFLKGENILTLAEK
jgi:SAM-dependent methyltransferase